MKYEVLFESVSDLARQLSRLHEQIANQQEPVVEHLIATKSRDTKAIEQTLDRLLDVACCDAGLKLFRRLCRHYWTINPEATACYFGGPAMSFPKYPKYNDSGGGRHTECVWYSSRHFPSAVRQV